MRETGRRGMDRVRGRWFGPALTLVTVALLETLAVLGYRVPNPPAFVLLAVVFAAYAGGLGAGLVSALIGWLYFAWSFSLPGVPFRYREPDLDRVIIWAFATPMMAILIGVLRRDADRARADAVRAAAAGAVAEVRTEAFEALRASEHRYRTLAATMVEGILILQDGRFAYANPGALELIGYPFEELQGREFAPFIFPEDRELVRERHRRRSAGETLEPRYDIRILPRTGEARWVQIANEKVEWEGRPAVLTVISDISERKRAEAALRESEQRFKALVELSSDWYWVTDAEHRFTFREGEILRRMGIAPEADYGMRRWEMGFINMDEAAWAEHRAVLERREEFRDLLLERRSPDGRIHWATISGRPLYDANGTFIGYHGTGRDVTQQVTAEQRLKQFNVELERKVVERTEALDAANRELEAFAYSVSHDLRAPLRAIDGFARLLEERHAAALAEEGRGYLRRVREGARRMNRLIEDLLAFSRVARAELTAREIDLSALARAVVAELAASAPERRIEWRIAAGLRAHADPGLIRVVLANVLGNAWKYTGRTERAVVELGRGANGEFFVRDNGVGFDPKYAAGLFEPFRRLHGEEEFEGSGIGLATVRRIIERHHGRVRAESAAGDGATFYFTLPPAPGAASR